VELEVCSGVADNSADARLEEAQQLVIELPIEIG
jgi:hypothetical protein